MGEQGAECFHTLTPGSRELTKADWDSERFGMVCTKADTFADWKAVIEKLCNKTGLCDYQTKAALNTFFSKVQELKKTSD